MLNIESIRAAVANDPLQYLAVLYGDTVKPAGPKQWRVGSRGGRKFDTRKGELLACDFTGDGESGDCFSVWQAHTGDPFNVAAAAIAALYGVDANGGGSERALRRPPRPRADTEAKLDTRPPGWPLLDARHNALWRDGITRLIEDAEIREGIATWRGWPASALISLAKAGLIGATDFDLWPSQIRPQPCALFRVVHPTAEHEEASGKDFWGWQPVQLHVRFSVSGASAKDGRALSWLYAPTMKALAVDSGGNAPLVIARGGRDPEQPGYGTRCERVICCAGEWDALTVLIAGGWIDDNGTLSLPPGLAIVGLRGEGRGGTDSFLRHYQHWRPRAVVMLADADDTGLSWFHAKDNRPCFAEQIEQRGANVIARAPASAKDVNDLFRAGAFGKPDVETLLADAGWKGAAAK